MAVLFQTLLLPFGSYNLDSQWYHTTLFLQSFLTGRKVLF